MKIATLLVACASLIATQALAQSDLKIGTSADAPPWEYIDDSGKLTGFDIELGTRICDLIKRNCKFENQAFDGLIPGLLVGKFDALMTSMAITEKRRQSVDFSIPYAPVAIRLVAAKSFGAGNLDTEEKLIAAVAGKSIGCQRGSTQEAMLKAHFPSSDIRTYSRIDEAVADLRAGRIDVASLNAANWKRLLVGDLAAKYDYIGPTLTGSKFKELGEGYGIALPKNSPELKEELDGAIKQLTDDGTVDKLAGNWLGISFKK